MFQFLFADSRFLGNGRNHVGFLYGNIVKDSIPFIYKFFKFFFMTGKVNSIFFIVFGKVCNCYEFRNVFGSLSWQSFLFHKFPVIAGTCLSYCLAHFSVAAVVSCNGNEPVVENPVVVLKFCNSCLGRKPWVISFIHIFIEFEEWFYTVGHELPHANGS